jgi:hypothetical protein
MVEVLAHEQRPLFRRKRAEERMRPARRGSWARLSESAEEKRE